MSLHRTRAIAVTGKDKRQVFIAILFKPMDGFFKPSLLYNQHGRPSCAITIEGIGVIVFVDPRLPIFS